MPDYINVQFLAFASAKNKLPEGIHQVPPVDRLQSMIIHDIFTSVGVFPAMGVHPRIRDPLWSDRISPVIEIRLWLKYPKGILRGQHLLESMNKTYQFIS